MNPSIETFLSPQGELHGSFFPEYGESQLFTRLGTLVDGAAGLPTAERNAYVYQEAYADAARQWAVQPERIDAAMQGSVKNNVETLREMKLARDRWGLVLEALRGNGPRVRPKLQTKTVEVIRSN